MMGRSLLADKDTCRRLVVCCCKMGTLLRQALIACVAAHAFTVLTLRRSILTEKVARRGHHVAREYAVDALEVVTVSRVMTREVAILPTTLTLQEACSRLFIPGACPKHQGYPVVDPAGSLVGIITRSDLADLSLAGEEPKKTLADLMGRKLVVAFPDESLRQATNRMLAANVGRLPIVARAEPDRLVGILTRSDVLKAHLWVLEEEERRERLLSLTSVFRWRGRRLPESHEIIIGATEQIS